MGAGAPLRHLGDVFDLAVHHGTLGVELLFYGADLHPAIHRHSQHSNDTAGSNIQCVDQVLGLDRIGLILSRIRHNFTNSF